MYVNLCVDDDWTFENDRKLCAEVLVGQFGKLYLDWGQ